MGRPKGIAAIGALIAAVGYLALSGGNVATQRAFIMVAVALGALILGRRALSLRAVAVAASLVLVLRPEALMGPRIPDVFCSNHRVGGGFWCVTRC